MEVGAARDRENTALGNEVKTLREMLDSLKTEHKD